MTKANTIVCLSHCQIRGKRKSRVLEEVTEGPKTVKIVLRHCNGKMERCFKKGAFFQVRVYNYNLLHKKAFLS